MRKFIIAILLLIPIVVILSINVSGLIISAEINIGIEGITLTHQGKIVESEQIILEDYKAHNKIYKLFVNYFPNIAQNKSIIWQSTDEKVATVINGIITFHDYGSVDIIATAESYTSISASCTFYVIGNEINSITVSEYGENSPKTEFYLKQYQVMPLKVSVIPCTALTEEKISYSSSENDIVSVDANGVITAKNTGNSTITVSAESKSGETVTKSINVTVSGKMLAKTDTYYTTDSIIDLSALMNYSDNTLSIDGTENDGYIVDIGNNQQTDIILSRDGNTETLTIIKKQSPNALVFENITALNHGIWLSDNYITEGSSNIILKAIAAQGVLPIDSSILWQSNNQEIVTVINGRLYAHTPGTAVITASLDGYESAEIEVKVATSISYIRLELDQSGDDQGLAEERVFGIYTCADKTVNNRFPLNIASSYPNVMNMPEYQNLFDYYSSNESFATVDADGIITFYPAGIDNCVTITAKAKYSEIDAKDSYTFHLVNGINIGYGYKQNNYDEDAGTQPSFIPYEDLDYVANQYKDDYITNKSVSAIVFHTNIYMPSEGRLIVICRSIYGNGYKFDGQFHTKYFTDSIFQYGIEGFFIQEKPCTVFVRNLAIQSYKPVSDDSEEAFNELAVKGGLSWQTCNSNEYYEGITYIFKFCIFQYAYTHCDISSGTVIFDGCIFRNSAGPAIFTCSTEINGADITIKNCIFSNIISTAFMSMCSGFPGSLQDAKKSRENVKYFTLRLEGDNYFYNWKDINDLQLKIIPDAYAPLNVINGSIAEWVRFAVYNHPDAENNIYDTLKGDYVNLAVVLLALWVDNNAVMNPPEEHFYHEGISIVADTDKYRLENVDLDKYPINTMLKSILNNYDIRLMKSPTNVVFAKGNKRGFNTAPDETYEINAQTLARLRGE